MVNGIGAIGGSGYPTNNITTDPALQELVRKYVEQGYTQQEALQKAQAELTQQTQSTSEVDATSSSQGVSSYGVSKGGVAGDDQGLQMVMQQPSYVGQDQLSAMNKFFLLGM